MDTTETPTTDSTELVVLDESPAQIDTPGFSSEVTKTLALSTATAAVLFGGYAVAAALLPKVRTWFKARKKNIPETVEKAKGKVTDIVENLTEKD